MTKKSPNSKISNNRFCLSSLNSIKLNILSSLQQLIISKNRNTIYKRPHKLDKSIFSLKKHLIYLIDFSFLIQVTFLLLEWIAILVTISIWQFVRNDKRHNSRQVVSLLTDNLVVLYTL